MTYTNFYKAAVVVFCLLTFGLVSSIGYAQALAQCDVVYAVHDKEIQDSQLFAYHLKQSRFAPIGALQVGFDLEGLDLHPEKRVLYASSGTPNAMLYSVNATSGDLTAVGDIGFDNVTSLAFHPTGELWAGSDQGLLQIDVTTGRGTLTEPDLPANQPIDSLAWDYSGTQLYATIRHSAENSQLWVYDASQQWQLACDNLPAKVESLETLPDAKLIYAFHQDAQLGIHSFDVATCQTLIDEQLQTPFNDIEGLAWPVETCVESNATALHAYLENLAGVASVTIQGDKIDIVLNGEHHQGALAATVTQGTPPATGELRMDAIDDQNGDNLADFLITYPNGEQQVLHYFGIVDETPQDCRASLALDTSTDVPTAVIQSLYSGINPIQTDVAVNIDLTHAAIVHGRVTGADGAALSNVVITIKDRPEYGETLTTCDGTFNMAVNSGGVLTVNYNKLGYLPAQREAMTASQQYALVGEVVLRESDLQANQVDLTARTTQVAAGSVVTDADGSRQAVVLFPAGVTATMTLADGSTQPLSMLDIRATEYTAGQTGQAVMPAPLPSGNDYVYAMDISIDQAVAANASRVDFSQAVPVYVDNFRHFVLGSSISMSWYDYERSAWIPSEDGLVMGIIGVDGGVAALDVDGSGRAADAATLAVLGISEEERRQLATRYAIGDSFWRTPVTHFTPYAYSINAERRLFDDQSAPDVKARYSIQTTLCFDDSNAIFSRRDFSKYDCAYPARDWSQYVKELFVVNNHNVCLKTNTDAESDYRTMTLADAKKAGIACVPVDTSNRVYVPQSALTHPISDNIENEQVNSEFIEGDFLTFNDGEHIYLTGTASDPVHWRQHSVPIYVSDMPVNGIFDFRYKDTYDPNILDHDFDYCYTVGQFTIKEGNDYVLTMTAYRVPTGVPCYTWEIDENGKKHRTDTLDATTIYYTTGTKRHDGTFQWHSAPKLLNAHLVTGNDGNIFPVPVFAPAPVSHTHMHSPFPVPGLPSENQLYGIHLDGNIYQVDGKRWFFWIWFDRGNHLASIEIDDQFSFVNSAPDRTISIQDIESKRIWKEPLSIVQNTKSFNCDINYLANHASQAERDACTNAAIAQYRNPNQLQEEGVNEGSSFFKRNGKYYMTFAHGHVVGCYSMSYIMADEMSKLTKTHSPVYPLFDAFPCDGNGPDGPDGENNIEDGNPGLHEIAGSGRAIKAGNDYYQFYGLASFDKKGGYIPREMHYSKLNFNPDGTIIPIKREPRTSMRPYKIPNTVQLTWTDLEAIYGTQYSYHLNILVNGAVNFQHPTNSSAGNGVCQLNAYDLRNARSAYDLSECAFVSDTQGFVGWVKIVDIPNLDGFQLAYARNHDWANSGYVQVGFTHLDYQFIPIDPNGKVRLDWTDLGNYQHHLSLLVNNSYQFAHPTQGVLGNCFLHAGELGYATYADISGCYFYPTNGAPRIWTPISSIPNVISFRIAYAFHDNWDMGEHLGRYLRGESESVVYDRSAAHLYISLTLD